MKTYEEIKEQVKTQIKNRELTGTNGEVLTLKSWKAINKEIRAVLKISKVKCAGVFYNPNDNNIYIKQSFRNERVNGMVDRTCSMEDVLWFVLNGNDKQLKGYYFDDKYFAIPYNCL